MFRRLSKWFYDLYEERVDRRIRNRRFKKLRQYCLEKGYDFCPKLLKSLPPFAEEVNRYIEDHARYELPSAQFNGNLKLENTKDFVEFGGVLGYNGSLFEIAYSPSSYSFVRFVCDSGGIIRRSSTGLYMIFKRDIERADTIIDIHSHPYGVGELTKGDIDHVGDILEFIGNKSYYYIVYLPRKNRSYWYQFPKV